MFTDKMIGKIMPERCIMKHYDKQNAYRWDISSEEEIRIINKLGLVTDKGENQVRGKAWKWQTRVYLLKYGVFDCIEDIATGDEIEALLGLPQSAVPATVWVEAVKRVTPSNSLLLKMIEKLETFTLLKVAEQCSGAFNDIKVEDLLVEGDKLARNIALLNILLDDRGKIWRAKILEAVKVSEFKLLELKGVKELFEGVISTSIKAGEPVTGVVEYIYKPGAPLYRELCESKCHIDVYAKKMIDFIRKAHPEDEAELEGWIIRLHNNVSDISNWRFLYYLICSSKESTPLYSRVLDALIKQLFTTEQWSMLNSIKWISEEQRDQLELKAIQLAKRDRESARFFYNTPFEKWRNKNLVKEMSLVLVEYYMFPTERISCFDEEIKKLVVDRMLVLSEISYLERSSGAEWMKLFKERSLSPEAEVAMLRHCVSRYDQVLFYISKYKLSELGFRHILAKSDTKGCGLMLLQSYEKTHGFSNNEWLMVAQSQYSKEFDFFLKYKK